jgi:hypothetical protein
MKEIKSEFQSTFFTFIKTHLSLIEILSPFHLILDTNLRCYNSKYYSLQFIILNSLNVCIIVHHVCIYIHIKLIILFLAKLRFVSFEIIHLSCMLLITTLIRCFPKYWLNRNKQCYCCQEGHTILVIISLFINFMIDYHWMYCQSIKERHRGIWKLGNVVRKHREVTFKGIEVEKLLNSWIAYKSVTSYFEKEAQKVCPNLLCRYMVHHELVMHFIHTWICTFFMMEYKIWNMPLI